MLGFFNFDYIYIMLGIDFIATRPMFLFINVVVEIITLRKVYNSHQTSP